MRLIGLAVVLTLSLFAPPLAVEAQQPDKIPRIGYLHAGTPPNTDVEVFRKTLNDLGYVEGRSITIEFRWAQDRMDRLSPLAAELVALKVDVIVVGSTPAIKAVAERTKTIPIIMTVIADPVAAGLVQSLRHPGGNVTGITLIAHELSGKRIELLKEAVQRLSRLAVLWNPANPTHAVALRESQSAARTLGLQTVPVAVQAAAEIDQAFATMARERVSALFVLDDTILFTERKRIAYLALRNRLPVASGISAYADAGALLTYGARLRDLYYRAAFFVDKIIKGAKAADLPVEQPTKFELVINLKTAKELDLTIPPSVLGRADRVIE